MNFKEAIINQSKDQVHALYQASSKSHQFDWKYFNESLPELWSGVHVDGITESEFYQIVEEVIPDHSDFEKIILPFQAAA